MNPEIIFYLILLFILIWCSIFQVLTIRIEDRMRKKAIERAKKDAEENIKHEEFLQKCKEDTIKFKIKMEEELKKRPNNMFLKQIVEEAKINLRDYN